MDLELTGYGCETYFPKNALLFTEGEDAAGFYFIVTGEVGLYKTDVAGRESEVARLKNGDYLGEVILFAAEKFPASARAVKDCCVLFFRKQTINAAIATNAPLAKFFLRVLAQKCLMLNQRLETLVFKTVRQRLLHFLLSNHLKTQSTVFTLQGTKQELAKRLGTIGATLSRNFAQLENEGLLSVSGRQIHLLDIPALRQQLG